MPLFPLLLLWVDLTQRSVPLIVHRGYFGILCSSLIIFCFSCVWYIASLRGYNQDWVFDCRFCLLVYQWYEWSVCILSWQFPKDLSDQAHHAWEEELVQTNPVNRIANYQAFFMCLTRICDPYQTNIHKFTTLLDFCPQHMLAIWCCWYVTAWHQTRRFLKL